jgi:hypothetical protein
VLRVSLFGADTVMRYLEQDFPKSQLERILGGAFREEGDTIDQLYQQILRLSLKGAEVLKTYQRAIGTIVLAKRSCGPRLLPKGLFLTMSCSQCNSISIGQITKEISKQKVQ